jgi:hypothetical protein
MSKDVTGLEIGLLFVGLDEGLAARAGGKELFPGITLIVTV